MPDRPGAWITTTARNRAALDLVRTGTERAFLERRLAEVSDP